jgi:hypothetical protein
MKLIGTLLKRIGRWKEHVLRDTPAPTNVCAMFAMREDFPQAPDRRRDAR